MRLVRRRSRPARPDRPSRPSFPPILRDNDIWRYSHWGRMGPPSPRYFLHATSFSRESCKFSETIFSRIKIYFVPSGWRPPSEIPQTQKSLPFHVQRAEQCCLATHPARQRCALDATTGHTVAIDSGGMFVSPPGRDGPPVSRPGEDEAPNFSGGQ